MTAGEEELTPRGRRLLWLQVGGGLLLVAVLTVVTLDKKNENRARLFGLPPIDLLSFVPYLAAAVLIAVVGAIVWALRRPRRR